MASALYAGETVHSRWRPAQNRFAYSLFMAYVDLAELDSGALDCWPLFSSRSPYALAALLPRDHRQGEHAPNSHRALACDIRAFAHERNPDIITADGPVRLLTCLRLFGLEFNPVSFYYLLDQDQRFVQGVVAEVNNIPWFQQHLYVLKPESIPLETVSNSAKSESVVVRHIETPKPTKFSSHPKSFHVSPFMPMDSIAYNWRIGFPGDTISIRIELENETSSFFMASLHLRRRAFEPLQLILLLISYPFMSIKVVLGIMYEAAKLWTHGAFAFYPHPDGAETSASRRIAAFVSITAKIWERLFAKR